MFLFVIAVVYVFLLLLFVWCVFVCFLFVVVVFLVFLGGDFGFCLFILLRFLLSSIGALTGLVWKWYLNFKYLTMLVSACLLSLKLSHPAHGN